MGKGWGSVFLSLGGVGVLHARGVAGSPCSPLLALALYPLLEPQPHTGPALPGALGQEQGLAQAC